MIVVDTDVLTYFWLGSPNDRLALAEAVRKQDPEWCAPSQWRPEMRNVLTTYMRLGFVTLEQALEVVNTAELELANYTVSTAASDVLQLAQQSGCTAYDCEFVAAARKLGLTLVTGDRKLARAFPGVAVTMEEFAGS